MAKYNFGSGWLYVNGIPMNAGSDLFGIGCGNIKYLVTAKNTATNLYYAKLHKNGVAGSDIFTSLVAAEDALIADQNDVLVVTPGLYTETATCDWTKDHTHLVGLGGPNVMTREGKPNTCLYSDTAGVDYVIHLTGDFCQFYNIQIQNGDTGGSADGDNLSAVGVAGYGNYFNHVLFRGINSAAQIADFACSSLEIMQGAGELLFDDCIVGQNGYGGTRTGVAKQGVMLWSATGAPVVEGMEFRGCKFLQRINSAADTPIVYQATQNAIDKLVLFNNCTFSSYWVNWGGTADQVFSQPPGGPATSYVVLKDCVARGFDDWVGTGVAAGNWIHTNQPASSHDGGLTVEGFA